MNFKFTTEEIIHKIGQIIYKMYNIPEKSEE